MQFGFLVCEPWTNVDSSFCTQGRTYKLTRGERKSDPFIVLCFARSEKFKNIAHGLDSPDDVTNGDNQNLTEKTKTAIFLGNLEVGNSHNKNKVISSNFPMFLKKMFSIKIILVKKCS